MGVIFEDEIFVDFIADGDEVMFDAKVSNRLQLGLGEDFPGWVMGGVDEDAAGLAGRDGVLEFSNIKMEIRPMEGDEFGDGCRHGEGGAIGVVVRFKEDDFVTGIEEAEGGGDDGFGATRGDLDLGVGVDGLVGEGLPTLGKGIVQFNRAEETGVLVLPFVDGVDGGLFDELRAVKIREAL